MRHGSLFSGIGGFDLAAEWMGWENVFHCDNNKFCQRILKYYWPDAKSYEDIKQTDFTEWNGKVDIVTGGFPCQPYSQAGKRKGKADDRHLWPEMLRAIREIKPGWVVAENVYGIVNWQRGMVFEEVLSDLENEGYFTQAYILPACAKNAPHRRDRLWIVANTNVRRWNAQPLPCSISDERENNLDTNKSNSNFGENGITSNTGFKRSPVAEQQAMGNNELSESGNIANAGNQGLQGSKVNGSIREIGTQRNEHFARFFPSNWQEFPTVSPIRRGNDGLSAGLVKQCLEGLGNAVVPQIPLEIFKAIGQFEGKLSE